MFLKFCATIVFGWIFFFYMSLSGEGITKAQAVPDSPSLEWRGFQGSQVGHGDNQEVPQRWDDATNLHWEIDLPGPGSSSPLVLNNRVYVTCYSGYGVDANRPGEIGDLMRHLICFDADTGVEIWRANVPNGEKEDEFRAQIKGHGYASSTPACDGKRLYCFFGKAGVVAFDMDGGQVWHQDVGQQTGRFKQGSGSSPILFGNRVIINAAEESRKIVALDKETGAILWEVVDEKLDGSYVTPRVVENADGEPELVVSMIQEVWGLDPTSGKQLWRLVTNQGGSLVPVPVQSGGDLILFGGMGGATYSLAIGQRGELTSEDANWTSRDGSIVPTPLLYDDHLYWANMDGVAYCVRASDGTLVYKKRLGRKSGCYASPAYANGAIYYVTRLGGTYVIPAKPEFEVLSHNLIEADSTRFDGTLAIEDGRIYLRSSKSLYCIGKQ